MWSMRRASCYLGWELIAICVQLFSPNKGLVDWLFAFFFDSRKTADDKIQKVRLSLSIRRSLC